HSHLVVADTGVVEHELGKTFAALHGVEPLRRKRPLGLLRVEVERVDSPLSITNASTQATSLVLGAGTVRKRPQRAPFQLCIGVAPDTFHDATLDPERFVVEAAVGVQELAPPARLANETGGNA